MNAKLVIVFEDSKELSLNVSFETSNVWVNEFQDNNCGDFIRIQSSGKTYQIQKGKVIYFYLEKE